jgi:hypothetical protein
MPDLDELERLLNLPARDDAYFGALLVRHAPALLAQAREAERLREALEKLADRAYQRRCTCSVIARAALQPQQETPDA